MQCQPALAANLLDQLYVEIVCATLDELTRVFAAQA